MGRVAYFLKEKRKETGFRPKQVAEELAMRGHKISPVTLYGYENGVSEPRIEVFLALCEIYGVQDILGEMYDL